MNARSRVDAVIVGAGIAGLTAAVALADAGVEVLVHEARDRVGGRAHSLPAGTGVIELGATWFWPDEPLTRSLSERFGLDTFAQHRRGDALFEPDRHRPQRLTGNPIDVESSRFVGGTQALAERLAEQLPPGRIRFSDPVTALTVTSDGVRVDTSGGSGVADQVILAVPPALAVDRITITPPLPPAVESIAAGTEVWMGRTVKAVAVYDTPFWRVEGLAGAAVSHLGPFREIHDHSGPGGHPAALFGFAPAERLAHPTASAIAATFRNQLCRIFGTPAAAARDIHIADWSRERFTTPEPHHRGSTATFGDDVFQKPAHDRIHWASTETATAYAGHIEGALRAGRRAAHAAAIGLGVRTVRAHDADDNSVIAPTGR